MIKARAGIAADPDTYELTDEELAELRPLVRPGRPKAEFPKVPITIRLSPEVLDFFKTDGPALIVVPASIGRSEVLRGRSRTGRRAQNQDI